MRVQAFCLCETLAVDSAEVEAIGLLTKPDFGDYWSPDEAFFDILRDKPTINAMVKEIAGKSCADGAVTDTAKLQKQIIKNRIAGHGVETASPDWLPRWAAFPAKPYKSVKGCAPAEAAQQDGKDPANWRGLCFEDGTIEAEEKTRINTTDAGERMHGPIILRISEDRADSRRSLPSA